MSKPIIVSGVQPTGNLHLGNYLGAVKNWVDLQNSGKYQMYVFIADLHSLTGNMPADQRRRQVIETATELLAAGIDPKKTTLFVQSQIKEHAELGWIFSCITPIAELERMTQYKDKSQQQEKNMNAGLFTYPVLQAADILLYHGNLVPVGQDQIQHVELTRDIARWFNNRYSASSADKNKYFPETKHLLTDVPKVMSLLEPEKKMSKSLGAGHVIELADEPDAIEQKLKKAVTATSGGGNAPGVQNLMLLLQKFSTSKTYQKFVTTEKDGSIRYGDLKLATGKAIGEYFTDFRKRRAKLLSNPNQLKKILTSGAKKAESVAKKTMVEVRERVGI